MANIILLEHFTSQSFIYFNKEKEILKEALNISNSIIKNFIRNQQVKKILVIRNEKLKTKNLKKLKTLYTNSRTSYTDILKTLNASFKIVLIAPETNKQSIKLYSSIPKKFDVLSSNITILKVFASKIETLNILKKFDIPSVNFYKKSFPEGRIIVKPNYGAGSDQIYFLRRKKYSDINNNYILQKFYKGIKGSFLMLCKNGKSRVICCNKQILKQNSEKIQQVGCIMGGLENYRHEIELLASKLCKRFTGFFGLIGVDIVREKGKWLVLEINSRFTSSYCGLDYSYDSSILQEITDFYLNRKLKKSVPKFVKKYNYYF